MLVPEAAKLKKKRWADRLPELRIRPVGGRRVQGPAEGGAARRRVRRRAGAAARQARCRQRGAGAGRRQARRDLQRAVRRRPVEVRARGQHARPVPGPRGGQRADRRARVPRPAEGRSAQRLDRHRLPVVRHQTPEHKAFFIAYHAKYNDYPRLGSVVGYSTIKSIAAGIKKAKSTDTEKLVTAFRRARRSTTPFGKITYRAEDQQSTMGAFVGKTKNDRRQGRDGRLRLPRRRESSSRAMTR